MLGPRFTYLIQHSLKTKGYPQNATVKSGGHSPGISTLCTQSKQTLCLLLILQDVTIISSVSAKDVQLLQGANGGSFLTAVFLREWVDVHPWASLSAHHLFHIVSVRLFIQLTSSALWGKAGADFITKASRRAMSAEIAPLAILATDGVGEGKLGMITAFCRTDQVRWNLQMHFWP